MSDTAGERPRPRWLLVGLLLAWAAYLASGGLTFPAAVDPEPGRRGLAATVFVASCWLSRSLPLGAASLLPLALFPLLAVQPMAAVTRGYADPILWMFFGGFVLARAIERFGLHRRLALHTIVAIGARPRRLIFGFMLAGMLLSMWISNTATALMLLPIGMALADRVQHGGGLAPAAAQGFGVALMLGIAYGCSIGGTVTPIGTAPNLIFFARGNYGGMVEAGAPELSFLMWMAAFAPLALAAVVVVWLLLARVMVRLPGGSPETGAGVRQELAALGRMASGERRVLGLFVATVLLWVTRGDLRLGGGWVVPGWASLVGLPDRTVTDGTIAVGMALLAFVVPAGGRGSPPLMDWRTASSIPFDILFLLGGGVAIADAFAATGLCAALATAIEPLVGGAPPLLAVGGMVLFMTFLTEVTSNTAVTSLMLPVMAALAKAAAMDPRLLMLPTTIAASCAFMLPVATPPNAVVFASGRVGFGQMARVGLVLNLVSVPLLTGGFFLWVFPLLGIEPGRVPEWW